MGVVERIDVLLIKCKHGSMLPATHRERLHVAMALASAIGQSQYEARTTNAPQGFAHKKLFLFFLRTSHEIANF